MNIGYIRVSTQEQNTVRQEALMESLGVDEVYIDRMSGKSTDRPELKKMMEYVRQGDTVIVESISRFARNTHDLLELVERLTAKGVEFVSKKEAIDTTTPSGKFMLTIRQKEAADRFFFALSSQVCYTNRKGGDRAAGGSGSPADLGAGTGDPAAGQ